MCALEHTGEFIFFLQVCKIKICARFLNGAQRAVYENNARDEDDNDNALFSTSSQVSRLHRHHRFSSRARLQIKIFSRSVFYYSIFIVIIALELIWQRFLMWFVCVPLQPRK